MSVSEDKGAPEAEEPARIQARIQWGREDLWIILPLLALALGVRLYGLIDLTFIDDELSHIYFLGKGAEFVWDAVFVSALLPVWFFMYKAWILVAGIGLGAKLFSVMWGVLSVLCLYGAMREVRGRWVSAAAAGLLAVIGFHIHFSQIATPYAFLTFLGSAALWTLLATLRRGSAIAAALHVLVLVLANYTHQSGPLLWGAELAGVLLLLALKARGIRPRPFLVAQGVALLLSLGLIPILSAQWQAVQQIQGISYLPEVSVPVLLDRLHGFLAFGSQEDHVSWVVEAIALGVALAGALVAAVRSRRRGHGAPWATFLFAMVLVSPMLLCAILGALVRKELLYETRFFAIFIPALPALTAAVAGHLAGRKGARWRKARAVAAACLLLVLLAPQAGSLRYLFGGTRTQENFPIHEISKIIAANSLPGDMAVVHSSFYLFFFDYFYAGDTPRFIGAVTEGFHLRPFGGLHDVADQDSVAEVMERLAGTERVWLVLTPTTNAHLRDPDGLIVAGIEQEFDLDSQQCWRCDSGDPIHVKLMLRTLYHD